MDFKDNNNIIIIKVIINFLVDFIKINIMEFNFVKINLARINDQMESINQKVIANYYKASFIKISYYNLLQPFQPPQLL